MKNLLTMNKGEWSEAYTFLKLLADGKLYSADKNLNKIESIYYPLIKVFTEEEDRNLEYIRNGKVKIIDSSTKEEILSIETNEFIEISQKLLNVIKNEKKTFGNQEIQDFLYKIEHKKLKSGSREKKDITIMVHDIFTGYTPVLGFSIKSKLGNPSTLFNSSRATNFIYKVSKNNMSETEISSVNNINDKGKIIKRVQKIFELGYYLEFVSTFNDNFLCNLQLVDSSLPEILSYLLIYSYKYNETNLKKLLKILNNENPLDYRMDINENFYEYKLKKFLVDSALGMRATDVWTGKFDATGGYIVVREDGEILCYHIYNHNEFEDYLLLNTRLETPSSRNKFGEIYTDNNQLLFRLNLQVRFI